MLRLKYNLDTNALYIIYCLFILPCIVKVGVIKNKKYVQIKNCKSCTNKKLILCCTTDNSSYTFYKISEILYINRLSFN